MIAALSVNMQPTQHRARHVKRMGAAVSALTLVAMSIIAPSAAATSILDMVVVEGDAQDGELVIACLAPFFTNCSLAAAFSSGGCVDLKVRTVCASISLAAIGGLSSIAVNGGGANGNVLHADNSRLLMSCSWPGTSGGCAAAIVDFAFECVDTFSANSVGYLSAPDIVSGGIIISPIRAPPAKAVAPEACILDGVLGGSAAEETKTPAQAERELEQMLTEAADAQIAIQQDVLAQAGLQLEPSELARLTQQVHEAIRGVSVTDDYEVLWPAAGTSVEAVLPIVAA